MFLLFFILFFNVSCDWIKVKENSYESNFIADFTDESNPRARFGSAFWMKNDTVWFFGGGVDTGTQFNDLWKYSVSLNQYSFVGGGKTENDPGNYTDGVLNKYDVHKLPKSRILPSSITLNDTFLLLGGTHISLGWESDSFNEIWEYSPSLGQWRLIKENTDPIFVEYGTNGTFDSANTPHRFLGCPILKRTEDVYVTFIGQQNMFTLYNEIWEYSTSLNYWRFVKGKKYLDQSTISSGIFPPQQGMCGVDYLPPGRGNHCAWYYKDSLYIYGGIFVGIGITYQCYSDLWKIKLVGNDSTTTTTTTTSGLLDQQAEWCYISGSRNINDHSHYKDKEWSTSFYPGHRMMPSCVVTLSYPYIDNTQNIDFFFIFGGGSNSNSVADGWLYNPESNEWKLATGSEKNLPNEKDQHYPLARLGSVFFRYQNNTYIMGGYDAENEKFGYTDVWIYNRKEFQCFGTDHDSIETCDGHGRCVEPDECVCEATFYIGRECTEFYTTAFVFLVIVPSSISLFFVFFILCVVCLCLLLLCFFGVLFFLFLLQQGVFSSFFKRMKLRNIDLLLNQQEIDMREKLLGHSNLAKIRIDHSLYKIRFSDIKLISLIGSGGSGSRIYKCEMNGRIYAYKGFRSANILSSQSHYNEFEKEISILGSIRHDFICPFYGATVSPPNLGMILEYCEHGDLKCFLKNFMKEHDGKSYRHSEKMRIIEEIAEAMSFLHLKSILHRDLKLENVLVDSLEHAKVVDFGLSRVLSENESSQSMTKGIGTSIYMSPELIKGELYSFPVDMYAFGIMMWIILSDNFKPYEGEEVIPYKVANDPSFRPNLKEISKEPRWIKKIIKNAWNVDEEKRPTFEECLYLFRKQNKKHSSITIYFGRRKVLTEREKGEEEEDFELKERSLKELESIVHEKWKDIKSFKLYLMLEEGVFIPLSDDLIVKTNVCQDSIIIVKYEE